MSLVENLVNQIATNGVSGITKPQGFDMNDNTFANLLDKQMSINSNFAQNNLYGEMGMPAGLVIEPLEETSTVDKVVEFDKIKDIQPTQEIEIKDIKIGDYFSQYLSDLSHLNSPIMNMAVKQAANSYGNFGRNMVYDISEFAQGIATNS